MPSSYVGDFRFTTLCMPPNLDSRPLLIDYRCSFHDLPGADQMEQETLSPRRTMPRLLCLGNIVNGDFAYSLLILETSLLYPLSALIVQLELMYNANPKSGSQLAVHLEDYARSEA